MHPCQFVSNIVLGEHDLFDPCKILGLLILHPEKLGRRKPGKRNVRRILRQLILPDLVVQIIALFRCSSVIPENCGTDYLVLVIQNHKPVHLSAKTDPGNPALVHIRGQLLDARDALLIPVFRLLLRPPRMRKIQRILLRHNIDDFAVFLHQKQLHCAGSQIYPNIKHVNPPILLLWIKFPCPCTILLFP